MPKTAADRRSDYELEVLRTTVFHSATKKQAKQAAIRFAYDHVLTQRLTNTSATARMVSGEHDERFKLAHQILEADEGWLAERLKRVEASELTIAQLSDDLIALAIDIQFQDHVRERAARAACRLAAVNQLRIDDHARFVDELLSPDE